MPFSGPTSYVPTINDFLAHWDAAEAQAGEDIVLSNNRNRDYLDDLGSGLSAVASTIQGHLNDREIARGFINIQKPALLDRLAEFNRKVRGVLGDTPYENALPKVPTDNAGEGKITGPLDDCVTLWGRINAATIPGFTGPLTLSGGYAVAAFEAELVALLAQYKAYSTARQLLKLALAERNQKQELAYDTCRDYRAYIIGNFPEGDPLVSTLPRLTPAPGHTPDTVQLQGGWDVNTGKAVLQWTASEDADLASYSIRYVVGDSYDGSVEDVLATVQPGEPLELASATGFGAAGSAVSYKVYVVLNTGNERGSDAVTVTKL